MACHVHVRRSPWRVACPTRIQHSLGVSVLQVCRSLILLSSPHFFCFLTDYSGSSGSGAVILDDCNFHESVHLDSFDVDRTLSLVSGIRLCYSGSRIT